MPWTFAHPAAVLPFARACPRRLHFGALAIGSLMPDLGYYIGHYGLSGFSHTAAGIVLACVPLGLLAWWLFAMLRGPVCELLPQPHRALLMPAASAPVQWRLATLAKIAASLALGALTHVLWDSFTHRTGWFVQQWPALQETAFVVGGTDIPVYELLQHASTLFGIAVLAIAYAARARPRLRTLRIAPDADRWRLRLIGYLGAASLCAAIPIASDLASRGRGYASLHSLLFHVAVVATVLLGAAICTCALVRRAARRPSS